MPITQRWRFAVPLLLAAGAAGGAGAAPASRPAPPPATAPQRAAASASAPAGAASKPAADYATPAAAAKTLVSALHAGDFTAVRDALLIDPAQGTSIAALLGTMESTARLQQAAAARFLDAGAAAFGAPAPADLAARLQAVDAGEWTNTGGTASLVLAADRGAQLPGGTILLKKVGADWKVDAAAFFKLAMEPADKTAARVALAQQLTAITDAMAQDIAAGKYFSAADAYQEYWTRCREATQPAAAATPAATTPATKP